MAVASTGEFHGARRAHTLSVLRLLITGAVTAGLVLVFCWLGTFIPFSSPTHGYITIFTNAELSSGVAFAEGTCWSLLFGALVGGAFALIYNATAALDRRQESVP